MDDEASKAEVKDLNSQLKGFEKGVKNLEIKNEQIRKVLDKAKKAPAPEAKLKKESLEEPKPKNMEQVPPKAEDEN